MARRIHSENLLKTITLARKQKTSKRYVNITETEEKTTGVNNRMQVMEYETKGIFN